MKKELLPEDEQQAHDEALMERPHRLPSKKQLEDLMQENAKSGLSSSGAKSSSRTDLVGRVMSRYGFTEEKALMYLKDFGA